MRIKQKRKSIKEQLQDTMAGYYISRLSDIVAEPVFILDKKHERCLNCKFYQDEICLFWIKYADEKCVMWEKS